MPAIPSSHRDLLDGEFATLGTIGPDGRPQLSEVWFLADGDTVSISLNTSRQKTKNLQANPAASLLILDLAVPYRYLEIRGDADALQPLASFAADRAGAIGQPLRGLVRRSSRACGLAASAGQPQKGGADHERIPHCFPPPCTRKAGSMPRSRMTASQILSTGVSKMRLDEMLELSHPPPTISRSSCPGPHPAYPRHSR